MDSDTVAQWWSMDVIRDERILCMEIPKSREQYTSSDNQTLLKSVLQNADERYKRRHAIAAICSSDCKSILPGGDERNYIGYRHTWLKMSTLSIEGLRQAFLDHESRIRFGETDPSSNWDYPTLESASIKDTRFLADQSLHFSPNLNVIIGGSGTGKSTIVNYLRMSLGQHESIRGSDVQANYERTMQTLRDTTEVSIRAKIERDTYVLTSCGRAVAELADPGPGPQPADGLDIPSLLPVRFYGQREIYNIADSRSATVGLIDDLHRDRLDGLDRRAAELQQEYMVTSATARRAPGLRDDIAKVNSQIARLQGRLERIQAAAEPLDELAGAQDAHKELEALRETGSLPRDPLAVAISTLETALLDVRNETLAPLAERYTAATQVLLTELRGALTKYNSTLASLQADAAAVDIEQRLSAAREEAERARAT